LDIEDRKVIVEKGIQEQEETRKKLVKKTCTNLIKEEKRITFIEVHRRTGLSRSRIEGRFRSLIEGMKKSQFDK